MSRIVLDANVAIDWHVYSEEGEAYSVPLWNSLESGHIRLCVPEHFNYEVSRILIMQARKARTSVAEKWLETALATLDQEPIDTFVMGINFQLLGQLTKTYELDAPDVPYFHMAREMGIPLATRDKKLIAACGRWGVLHWKPGEN